MERPRLWKLNRLYHHIKADLGGYFWHPCRLCGEMYGGHEKGTGSLMLSWLHGVMVCPWCADEAERRNEKFRTLVAPPAAFAQIHNIVGGGEMRYIPTYNRPRFPIDIEKRG